jgi:hypothetical protein
MKSESNANCNSKTVADRHRWVKPNFVSTVRCHSQSTARSVIFCTYLYSCMILLGITLKDTYVLFSPSNSVPVVTN